jgi:hypothetical protein
MPDAFRASEILHLDASRTCVPGGWDPLGLSTWDTSAGGLADGARRMGDYVIPVRDTLSPVWALQGPPTDRLAIWLVSLVRVDQVNTTDPTTPEVTFELRQGAGCVTTATVAGIIVEAAAGDPPWQGRMLQVSGTLGTQWELHARVASQLNGGAVKATFRCLLDRTGQPPAATGKTVVDDFQAAPHVTAAPWVTLTAIT